MSFHIRDLFRIKPPMPHDVQGGGLKRVLSAFDLTLLGVGAIIGTGIFVLTGVAAATASGPAVVLSFIVSGIVCAFAALAYAELSSSVGGAGSAYGYAYAAFGELVAWVIGWVLLLEYGVAVATVANGWSGYFTTILTKIGLAIPEQFTKSPEAGGIANIPAMVIILILMGLLCYGVRQSARLNAGMVFIKILTIAVFIAVAAFNVQPELWTPFMPFGWFDDSVEPPVGILAGASLVFFAYVGFDAVSTAVEEAKNPQRDVPLGLLGSLLFCTVIYIVVSGLLTGIVPYTDLNVAHPVAHALELLGINWASALVSTGVIFGLTTVMLVLYYALTRIIFAMSRDGLLPAVLSEVNDKTHTPVKTTIVCGLIMALLAGVVPLKVLAELVNIGTLSAFVIVCIGVVWMRIKHPDMERPFKIPFGIPVSIVGALACASLILFLPAHTHIWFLYWLSAGVMLYFVYSFWHSKLRQ